MTDPRLSPHLSSLKAAVAGEVLTPADLGFPDSARTLTVQGHPSLVVRCGDSADVGTALRYAQDHNLGVAVRSGGHHLAGFGTNDGGLVIDLRRLDEVRVRSERPDAGAQVRLGPGATWGQVARTLADGSWAISSGDTASVGVGGLLGGGGIGWLVRRDGLGIDAMTGAEVVTADGTVRRVDAHTDSDLFWGIRGAAGSLGVVTGYEIAATRCPIVQFGRLLFPTDQAERVLDGWAAYQALGADELSSTVALPPRIMADGTAPLMITVCYAGSATAAERELAPLRALGTLIGDTVTELPYESVLADDAMPADWVPRIHNGLFDDWTDDLTDRLLQAHDQIPSLLLEIRSLGAAFGRVDRQATAFAHRCARFMINAMLPGTPRSQQPQLESFDGFWQTLRPSGAYGNFLSHPTAADSELCFPGPTGPRLAEIKQRYDPDNVFASTIKMPPVAPGSPVSG